MRRLVSVLTASAWALGLFSAARADVTPPVAPVAAPVLVPNSAATTQYDPNKGFPDHNGPLSAMLVVIPKAELSEFNKPNGSSRHLDRVARAQPGAELALKLVFVGIQTDKNAMADLTYDLQVTGPDGKIYADSDYRAIQALKGKVANPAGLFDNRPQTVLMTFEPGDKPGIYQIKATLHDNVGVRDVPLQTSIELLPAVTVLPPANAPTLPVTAAPAPAITAPGATMAPIPDPSTDKPAADDDLVKTVRHGHVYWHHKRHKTSAT